MKKQLPGWAVLLIITLVAGLALGATYALTKDAIGAQSKAAEESARKAALPAAEAFESVPIDAGAAVDWCYAGRGKDGAIVGYVAQVTGQGFGGPLEVIAGLDTELVLTGVSVGGSNFSETAGLGAKSKEPAFTQQFIGKQAPVKVIKAGGTAADNTIDAITSATITSSAVVSAVNKIASHVEAILYPERANALAMPERPADDQVFGASAKGFAGPVWVEAAFDSDGKIIYISVGNEEFAESDGLGALAREPEFMRQFIGMAAPLTLADIDALSGATITSSAVIDALNKAYDASRGMTAPEEATPAPSLPSRPADDQVFGASAKGFAGPVWVDAAFDADGRITYISIGNDEFAETAGFGAKALETEFMAALIGKQMPLTLADIDAITGATYTSQAVVDALNTAYARSQGVEEATPSPVPTEAPTAVPAAADAAPVWTAESNGYGGPVQVAVSFDGDTITALVIGDERFAETDGLGGNALKPEFSQQFIGKAAPVRLLKADETPDGHTVDAIASATITSQAVIDAVNAAYEQSKADAAPTEAPAAADAAPVWTAESNGYGGPVQVAVSFDGDTITALVIGDERFAETDGLGGNALKPEFSQQFIGKAAPVRLLKADETPDGHTVDAIASATITSQAVIDAVNAAYEQSIAGQQ